MKNFQKIAAVFIAVSSVYFPGVASAETMDTFVVTAQRWIRDITGGSGIGGGGTEGGLSATAPEVSAQREQDRQQICAALNNSMQQNKCSTKETSPPANQYMLNIDAQRFPTNTFWAPAIFNAATSMFTNRVQDFGAFAGATAGAAIDACRGVSICIREVYVYFDINYVSLPDGGAFGNVNDLINDYMRNYLGPGRPPNPYFDKIIDRYANGATCVAAAQAAAAMKC